MRVFLKRTLPAPLWELLGRVYFGALKIRYGLFGRPRSAGETTKARPRRLSEGFFEKYCRGRGLDIGYGGDLLAENCRGFDFEDGDAQYLEGLPDEEFDFVYSSHTLEHLPDPVTALKNWWRVLKPGGYLIIYLPHRDLYEKKKTLPSRWNTDHKHFFLPDRDDPPDTIGVEPLLKRALSGFEVVYVKTCREGHTITDPEVHSDGEYSIEAVVRKTGEIRQDTLRDQVCSPIVRVQTGQSHVSG
jgi:SAM-dependent methyltransferase